MVKQVIINLAKQELCVLDADELYFKCQASTAAKGPGNRINSFCTPLGKHIIRAKIGDGLPIGSVLKGRRATGKLCTKDSYLREPDKDWILTRILWLSGCQPGYNRLGEVDTMQRYIYIHGSPNEVDLTQPQSQGCVRVANDDVIKLFDLLPVATPVEIKK
ncbi:MAG: L,D-transpeptidase [Candidatus Portiera sp.]|nr:L,D-transpeptidase [Portiera sp.]